MINAILILANVAVIAILIGAVSFFQWAGPDVAVAFVAGGFWALIGVRIHLGYWP
jgi:hypothetical protein